MTLLDVPFLLGFYIFLISLSRSLAMSNKLARKLLFNGFILFIAFFNSYDVLQVVPSIAIAFVTYEMVKDILGVEIRISD